MSTQKDSGHAKNAFNLDKLNQIITTFGASYNPANVALTLVELKKLHLKAVAKLTATNVAFNDWKNATNDREIAFQDLDTFSTKLLAALQSAGVTPQTFDDFKSLVHKMRGDKKITKADAGKTPNPNPPATPPVDDNSISNSQQSYDNKLQHFSQMVLLLAAEPLYVPNEVSMTVANLQAQLIALGTINSSTNNSYALLKAARIDRNTFFYKDVTGLLSIVSQVKSYVKSLYGVNSQQYKEVTAIPFFRVIRKKDAN